MRIGWTHHHRYPSALLLTALAVFTWPVLVTLLERWRDMGVEHGYAVGLMAGVLVYLEARRRPIASDGPSLTGLWLLCSCSVAILFARAADVMIVSQLLLPPLLGFAVWTVAGVRTARRFLLPLGFLYFAIPFWQAFEYVGGQGLWLTYALQAVTVFVVSGAVQVAGIPAFIDGNLIHLPSGTLEVAEGCSGRAYFVVALEVSLFYGIAYLNDWRSKVLLAAVAAALAMAGNWARVFLLVLIAHYSRMQHPLVADHELFGWVIFLLIVAPLALAAARLGENEPERRAAELARPIRHATHGAAIPVVGAIVLGGVIALGLRIEAGYSIDPARRSLAAIELANARALSAWSGETKPLFPGAASEVSTWYEYRGHKVGFFAADYPLQRQEREVIYFANKPAGSAAAPLDEGIVSIAAGEKERYEFRQLRVSDEAGTRIVWLGLRIAGALTADALEAKLLQVRGKLGGRADAQAFVLSTACGEDCAGIRELLKDFVRESMPAVLRAMPDATSRQADAASP